MFWEKNSDKVSFGLISGDSKAIGRLIEYDSMPSNDDDKDDSSYDCSIAFDNDHVSVSNITIIFVRMLNYN